MRIIKLMAVSIILLWSSVSQALTLTWQDANGANESGIMIERKSTLNGDYLQIDRVGPGISTWTDTTVKSGMYYCYRIFAFNSVSASAYSNEACAEPVIVNGESLSIPLPPSCQYKCQ